VVGGHIAGTGIRTPHETIRKKGREKESKERVRGGGIQKTGSSYARHAAKTVLMSWYRSLHEGGGSEKIKKGREKLKTSANLPISLPTSYRAGRAVKRAGAEKGEPKYAGHPAKPRPCA